MEAGLMRIRQAQRLCFLCLIVFPPLIVWPGALLNIDTKHFVVRTLTAALCALLAAGSAAAGKIRIPYAPIPILASVSGLLAFAGGLAHPFGDWRAAVDGCIILAFFLASLSLTRDPGFVRLLLSVWVASAVIVCAYFLLQLAGLDPVKGFNPGHNIIGSTLGNRNFMAFYLLAAFPFCLYLYADSGRILRIFHLSSAFLLAATLAVSGSRAGMGILALALPAIIVRLRPTSWPRLAKPAALGMLCLFAAGMVAAFSLDGSDLPNAKGLGTRQLDALFHGRLGIWKDTFRVIAANPWLGHGPGSFERVFPTYRSEELGYTFGFLEPVFSSHNVSLDLICEGGMAGWLVFLALAMCGTGRLCRRGATADRHRNRAFFSGMSLIGCGVFSLVGEIHNVLFCTMFSWLVLAIFYNSISGRFRAWRPPEGLRRPVFLAAAVAGTVLAVAALGSFGSRFLASIEVRKARDCIAAEENPALARRFLDKALALEPGNLYALYQHGYLDMWQGRPRHALKRYAAIQSLHPYFENVHYNMGLAWHSLGEHRKAAEAVSVTCRLYPTFGDASLLLAKTHLALGEFDAAQSRCDHLDRIGYDRGAVQALRHAILNREIGRTSP